MSSTIQNTHEGEIVYHKYLEFVGANADNASGKSNKFWEIAVIKQGGKFTVVRRWGKYGTKGQTKDGESFYDKYTAKSHAKAHQRKKRDKGYTKEIDVITRLGTLVNGDAA
jgi:predicted DNA-binding WGR domain protein